MENILWSEGEQARPLTFSIRGDFAVGSSRQDNCHFWWLVRGVWIKKQQAYQLERIGSWPWRGRHNKPSLHILQCWYDACAGRGTDMLLLLLFQHAKMWCGYMYTMKKVQRKCEIVMLVYEFTWENEKSIKYWSSTLQRRMMFFC